MILPFHTGPLLQAMDELIVQGVDALIVLALMKELRITYGVLDENSPV